MFSLKMDRQALLSLNASDTRPPQDSDVYTAEPTGAT